MSIFKNRSVKALFKHDNKLFIQAISDNNENNSLYSTYILTSYDEQLQYNLKKILQRIIENKQAKFKYLIYPNSISIENFEKNKMIVLPLKIQLVSTSLLVERKKYKFTQLQIIEATNDGFRSLKQLHSLKIVHGEINPHTCYFFNKNQPGANKIKAMRSTFFGVGIADIGQLQQKITKIQNQQDISENIFHSKNRVLGLKTSYKDDLQCLIYVLVYMLTSGTLFSSSRCEKQWHNLDGINKWKLNKLIFQLFKSIPDDLVILMQLYLSIQQLDIDSSFNYNEALKKIGICRDKLISKQHKGQSISQVLDESVESISSSEMNVKDQIDQEEIHLIIHSQFKGTNNICFTEEEILQ